MQWLKVGLEAVICGSFHRQVAVWLAVRKTSLASGNVCSDC
jgi:hypothetical protein